MVTKEYYSSILAKRQSTELKGNVNCANKNIIKFNQLQLLNFDLQIIRVIKHGYLNLFVALILN